MGSTAVDFRAACFDAVIQSPTIQSTSFADEADAHAFVNVSAATMKTIFFIKTSDDTGSNMKFYLDKAAFLGIDLSNAVMETTDTLYNSGTMDKTGLASSTNNGFAHDFLRYISDQIFGSIMGVGLFTNNTSVTDRILNDFVVEYTAVAAMLDLSTNTTRVATYGGVSVTVSNDSDGYYVDSSGGNQNSLNVGWTLFQRLVATQPDRASTFLNTNLLGTKTPFPFEAGDTMSVFVTVNANPEQRSITALDSSAIANRTYRIRIKVT